MPKTKIQLKTKKVLIIGITIALIFGVFYYFLVLEKPKNEILVSVDNSLSVENVKIEYGLHSINSKSDENILTKGFGKVVYAENKQISFETVCGENDFLVTYENKYYAIVRHFIPNDFYDGIPKPHKYIFDLKKRANKIHMILNIEGQDGEKIEKELVNVFEAKNKVWGKKKINARTANSSFTQWLVLFFLDGNY